MARKTAPPACSTPEIGSVILTVRGHRVILDADLAVLYGVTDQAFE